MKNKPFDKSVFAFPYIAICAVFVVFPLVLVFVYAFRDADGGFTFENFAAVFLNSSNYVSIGRSLLMSVLSTVICLLIAYPVAYILASSRFNKKAILALLFVVPMWMNFVLRMYALQSLMELIGIMPSFWAALIGMVYDFLPFMLLPIYTVLVSMDRSYIEASYDLGAGRVKTFIKVTLPLSLQGIVSGVLMVFMPVMSAFAITDILGDASSAVIGFKINFYFANFEWGIGSALAFMLLILVMIMMGLTALFNRRNKSGKADAAVVPGGRPL